MNIVSLIRRLRDEFTTMPGLRLSEAQAQRVCDANASTCASALRALVSAGFLCPLEDGSYRRADIEVSANTRSTSDAVEPPWRRILCPVEFEDDTRSSLTAASHSALSYAITLGVTHRARITALHLVPSLPAGEEEHQALVEQLVDGVRRHTLGQRIPGLLDIHVAPGTSNDSLLRAARESRADLIVVGRQDGDEGCFSRLRERLSDVACHVLVVHPSGQAAVA
jgi:nucleotide-binding universal stress UspA family protein